MNTLLKTNKQKPLIEEGREGQHVLQDLHPHQRQGSSPNQPRMAVYTSTHRGNNNLPQFRNWYAAYIKTPKGFDILEPEKYIYCFVCGIF